MSSRTCECELTQPSPFFLSVYFLMFTRTSMRSCCLNRASLNLFEPPVLSSYRNEFDILILK